MGVLSLMWTVSDGTLSQIAGGQLMSREQHADAIKSPPDALDPLHVHRGMYFLVDDKHLPLHYCTLVISTHDDGLEGNAGLDLTLWNQYQLQVAKYVTFMYLLSIELD